jgi:hypothetical protein
MTGISRRGLGAAMGLAALALETQVRAQTPARATLAAPAAPKPNLPSPVAILAMIRSSLLAIDHANRTGNYTVLRDLAGPQFRDANSAAKLAQIFGPVVAQGVDLLAVAVVEPTYAVAPNINAQRMLHASGVFRMPPKAAAFEILFETVGPSWRLFAVGVQAV